MINSAIKELKQSVISLKNKEVTIQVIRFDAQVSSHNAFE